MMREAHGNLLRADVQALVNTVNTEGVMGKGIALQFKRAYPKMFHEYARVAKAGGIELGKMHVWPTGLMAGPRYIINFPTKGHWRTKSRLADVETGLVDLVRIVKELDICSLAVPPLGCGNGGLDWSQVEPMIQQSLGDLTGVDVLVFAPGTPPRAEEMVTAPRTIGMTRFRASFIGIITRYGERALDVSLIEVQKLMYFLQAAGEPLKLSYVAGKYGPYADDLRHVLTSMEGHFTIGFGDGSAHVLEADPIRILPSAVELAGQYLEMRPESLDRIDRVLDLVDGFESSYGTELLASVHWVCSHSPDALADPKAACALISAWTSRKADLFTDEHVAAAWSTLRDQGWLSESAQLF